jgi:transposase
MALCSKTKVPLPDSGLIIRRSGKYQYVYKVLSTYRAENGQPTNTRRAIGKLDTDSGMLIPNDAYWEYYGEESIITEATESELTPSFESVHSVGASFLVARVLESLGITGILKSVFGKVKAMAILTAVIYMVCRGNVFEHVGDWCDEYTLQDSPLTSPGASTLFSSIAFGERMAFFRAWVALQADNEYFAYDVTSFSSYAAGIMDTEWGYNRDKEKLPQINLGCYMGQKSGLPVFYVTYPGSIVDKSHLQYMMSYNETLGIKNVCFVMDKGFCTTSNIQYMHSSGRLYVVGAETGHKATGNAINEVRDSIVSMRYQVAAGIYARSVRSRFFGCISTMHIYFSPELAERQRRDLYRTVEIEEEKLRQLEQLTKKEAKRYQSHFNIEIGKEGTFKFERNYDKIDNAAKNCGYFCILTNTDATSAETLTTYRNKDTIEKGFDDLKNHIDMKRMRTHSSKTTDGKMFCAFVALIAVLEMNNRLSSFMKEKSMSKDSLIYELEKIKTVFMSDGKRLMNPITKTQRTIFEACGLTEEDLKLYVTCH